MIKSGEKVSKSGKMNKYELVKTILECMEYIEEGSLTIIKQDNCIIQINTSKKINLA